MSVKSYDSNDLRTSHDWSIPFSSIRTPEELKALLDNLIISLMSFKPPWPEKRAVCGSFNITDLSTLGSLLTMYGGLLKTKSKVSSMNGLSQSPQIMSILLCWHSPKFFFATFKEAICISLRIIFQLGRSFAIEIPTHPDPQPASKNTHLFLSSNTFFLI